MPTTSVTPLQLLTAIARPNGLLLASDAVGIGLKRELRTALEHRQVVRLRWGVYMLAAQWAALKIDQRYLCRIRALAAMSEEPPVFSHYSAAAIWGLPRVGLWPATVHIQIPPTTGGRSRNGITRHTDDEPLTVVERNGLRVTSVTQTAVAMARILPFAEAVAMMDKTIHVPRDGRPLATREQLESALATLASAPRVTGRAQARRAGEFATTQSGSAGESVSRALIFLLGFLAPELQVRFDDANGFIGYTDFFWRTANRIGEFDGFGKYLREEFLRGRTTAQVIIEEKLREDRLRGCGPRVARWEWPILRDPREFGAFLTRKGIPRAR